MFTGNPFAELSAYIASGVTQAYVVVMFILVVAGTLIDVIHKKSARYFFEDWQKSNSGGAKRVGGGEVVGMAVQTFASEVLTSSEFCAARRRIAHLLTMYGFVAYVVATAVMVFAYPTSSSSDTRYLADTVAHWSTDGLCRRLLVLVLHPGGCHGGGLFAVSHHTRRPVHPFTACQHDTGPGMVMDTNVGNRVAGIRAVCAREHDTVRIRTLVQVCTHVFQAFRRTAKAGSRSSRYEKQFTGTRRQARNIRQGRRAATKLLASRPVIIGQAADLVLKTKNKFLPNTGDDRIACPLSFT